MNSEAAGFVSAVLAQEALRKTAVRLHAQNVAVMPFKGVLLGRTVYAQPADRPLTDIDILVPPGHMPRALSALRAAGYAPRFRQTDDRAVMLSVPGNPFLIDLHERFFQPHWFRLDEAGVFARSSLDTELFGAPVHLPDPYDLYAQLVGHFAKSRFNASRTIHLEDLKRVPEQYELDVYHCAEHLARYGLARAGRYALGLAASASNDAFARSVVEALPSDRVGRSLVALARIGLGGRAPSSVKTAAAHFLNGSLRDTRRAAAFHLVDAVRRRGRPLPA